MKSVDEIKELSSFNQKSFLCSIKQCKIILHDRVLLPNILYNQWFSITLNEALH